MLDVEVILLREELVVPTSTTTQQQPQPQPQPQDTPQDKYIDTAVGLRCILKWANLDFLYIFEQIATEVCVDKLQESLRRVLCDYPTLAGRLVDEGKRVHCNNQGVWFRVQNARRTAASIHDIPVDPATTRPYCWIPPPKDQVAGKAPLLTVTVTNFQNGCALGVVMNHGVADAWTFAMFMKDWSRVYQSLGQNINVTSPMLSKIQPTISEYPPQLLHIFATQDETNQVAHTLDYRPCSWIQQQINHIVLRQVLPLIMSTVGDFRCFTLQPRCILHYTDEQMKAVKTKASARVSHWISTNEALLLHVWQLLLDAAHVTPLQRNTLAVQVPVNLRDKIPGVTRRHVGNIITGTILVMDMNQPSTTSTTTTDTTTDTTKWSLEQRLHNAMREILQPHKLLLLTQLVNTMFDEDQPRIVTYENVQVGDFAWTPQRGCFDWNWQGHNPYFQIDFQDLGPPLRGIPWNWQVPVTVVPAARGGLNVYIDTTSRGPAGWKARSSVSKWSSTLLNILGLVVVPGAVFVWSMVSNKSHTAKDSYHNNDTNNPFSVASILMSVLLCLGSSQFIRQQAWHAAKQEFFDYVKTHAYRGL